MAYSLLQSSFSDFMSHMLDTDWPMIIQYCTSGNNNSSNAAIVTQYELYFILIGSLVIYHQVIKHGITKYSAVHREPRNFKGLTGNLKIEAQQECFSV